ncbi:MAG: L,D-transpeptidase family protein [Candidatus Omnitrophota bacterium]
MNNRLLGAVIGFILVVALVYFVFGSKNDNASLLPSEDAKSIKALISSDKLDEAKKLIDEKKESEPENPSLGNMYFLLATSFEGKGYLVKARDVYEKILTEYQNVDNILEIQEKIGELNIKILFSNIMTDNDIRYEVMPGDTLSEIAKKFSTTVDMVKACNSLKDDVIRVGSNLKVPQTQYRIMVDKSQNILTLLTDKDRFVKVYKVSTGANNCTPVGTFKIVNKIKDPVWYTEGAIVPAESPDNILGSRWLGLSEKGYGIHGTTEPESLGKQATQGCIRMLNAEVEELYTIVPTNVEVTIME